MSTQFTGCREEAWLQLLRPSIAGVTSIHVIAEMPEVLLLQHIFVDGELEKRLWSLAFDFEQKRHFDLLWFAGV
jgi:hypothetical protein